MGEMQSVTGSATTRWARVPQRIRRWDVSRGTVGEERPRTLDQYAAYVQLHSNTGRKAMGPDLSGVLSLNVNIGCVSLRSFKHLALAEIEERGKQNVRDLLDPCVEDRHRLVV